MAPCSSTSEPFVANEDYLATGCSHGGGVVTQWAVQEIDHPARTFAVSGANLSIHCTYHFGFCPWFQQQVDEALEMSWPHDDSDPRMYDIHRDVEKLHLIDAELTRSRELGASWGDDPGSSHYNDLTEIYAQARHKPFWFEREEVEANLESKTELVFEQ
ncbi:hypothetical protein ACFL6C_02470 [Myxococcota bacterium]